MICTSGTKVPPSYKHDASYVFFSVYQLSLWRRGEGKNTINVSQKTDFILINTYSHKELKYQ